jgi:hypothetical protein
MRKYFLRWNIAIRLKELARIRDQFIIDVFEIPDNIGTIAVFLAPHGLRIYLN